MYLPENDYYIPAFEENNIQKIIPIAAFIGKKIKANKIAFITSSDADEKTEINASLSMCQSALCLLCLAYISESDDLVEIAKEIIREK